MALVEALSGGLTSGASHVTGMCGSVINREFEIYMKLLVKKLCSILILHALETFAQPLPLVSWQPAPRREAAAGRGPED